MRRIYQTALVCVALILGSCGTDEGFTTTTIPSGVLTVVNAIPDSPDLIAVRNGIQLATVGFGESSTPSNLLPQIPLTIQIRYTDETSQPELLSTELYFEISEDNQMVLTGTMENPDFVLIENLDFDYAEDSTLTRIRFLNVTSDVLNATLTLTNPNDPTVTRTIALAKDQPSEYVPTESGTGLEIEITDTDTGEVLWTSGEFTVTPQADRLFVLRDYFGPGDNTVKMFSVNEQSGTGLFFNEQVPSEIRFANMITDQTSLDVMIDDEVILSDVAFGAISDFVNITAGTKALVLTPHGDPETELHSVDLTLSAGFFYTLGAAGLEESYNTALAPIPQRPVFRRNTFTLLDLTTSFTDGLDFYLLDTGNAISGTPLFDNITSGIFGTVELIPGTYDYAVTGSSDTTALIGPSAIQLDDFGQKFFILSDTLTGGLQAIDVEAATQE